MPSTIIFNKPFLVKWADSRIPGDDHFPDNAPCMGVIRNGKIRAVAVFTQYTGNGICMNIASDGSGRWLTKSYLKCVFEFPFVYLGCRRVTGLVRVDNKAAQRFDEHLGFKKEGIIREGDDDGTDLILYGMLKHECKWLEI